jgi:hypothetical protein
MNNANILFDYQTTDWVNYLSQYNTEPTILATCADNTLWAVSISPICTIDYPRTNSIIPQETNVEARAFSFSPLDSAQILVNSKPYRTIQINGTYAQFDFDLDLSSEALSAVNIQCMAIDSQMYEIDRLGYKVQPIISTSASKEKIEVQIYPKRPIVGQKFKIYLRDSEGLDLQDVNVGYESENLIISSPYEMDAQKSGEYVISVKKTGYEPAQMKFSIVEQLGVIPYVLGAILLAIAIGGFWIYFSKNTRMRSVPKNKKKI